MKFRGVRIIAQGMLVSFALSGCVSLPDQSGVQEGGTIHRNEDALPLDFSPASPEEGASPERILQGFLDAALSPDNNFSIAREYLTAQASEKWNPDERVLIDDSTQRVFVVGDSRVELSVTPNAYVDDVGVYSSDFRSEKAHLSFDFVHDHTGQWRISGLPGGVVVESSMFTTVYEQHVLYFYTQDFEVLVPDVRWFPYRVPVSVTRAVRALISGPSAWLQSGVVSALPEDTVLSSPAVVRNDGSLHIELVGKSFYDPAVASFYMNAQLQASLGAHADSIFLSINSSNPELLPALGRIPVRNPRVDAAPFVCKQDECGLLELGALKSLEGMSQQLVALNPARMTLASSQQHVVGKNAMGIFSISSGKEAVFLPVQGGAVGPALDRFDWIWMAPQHDVGHLVVVSSAGVQGVLPLDMQGATNVYDIAMSRDGARLAVAAGYSDGSSRMLLFSIARDNAKAPIQIGLPNAVLQHQYQIASLAWTDETTLAVLSNLPQGGTLVSDVNVSGPVVTIVGPKSAVNLVAAPVKDRFFVFLENGVLQVATGTGWSTRYSGVSVLGDQVGK